MPKTQYREYRNREGKIVKIFDPRIISADQQDQRLWSSQSVKLAENGITQGYELSSSPWNKRIKDARLRMANLPFQYTKAEIEVIKRCNDDILFFGNNFISLKDAEEGWQRITLRDYQEDLLGKYDKNRFNIVMFPRQSGKTTTTIVKICHFLKFNRDKDCVVIAQSQKVIDEILTKIREAFSSMPFFLQPGFLKFNKDSIALDNGCRLKIGVASESVVQGYSLDLLFVDEFAYIKSSMINKFWDNIYPSLTNNSKSRCIIASTPNGRNKFYDLWNGAINGDNTFVTSRIYWYDVPRKQTPEEFKRETIANSSLEAWLMGFECSFDVGLKTVFSITDQQMLRASQQDWSIDEHNKLSDFGFEVEQGYVYDYRKDWFLLSIDIGEGLGQDSTVIKVNKLEWNFERKRLQYHQFAVFRDNTVAVEDFAALSVKIFKLFNPSHIRVVVENNTYGGEYFANLKAIQMLQGGVNMEVFAKFGRKSKKDLEYGLHWNEENKKVGVRSFTKIVHNGTFTTTHRNTIEEYLNFGLQKNGTYKANYGHDDLCMADITASYYICSTNVESTAFFKEAEYSIRLALKDEEILRPIILEEKRKERNKLNMRSGEWRHLVLRDHEKEMHDREHYQGNYAVEVDDKSILCF